MAQHWINTVSRDHVLIGVNGGFTQANHGRSTVLRRLARGDLVAFYSPRTRYPVLGATFQPRAGLQTTNRTRPR